MSNSSSPRALLKTRTYAADLAYVREQTPASKPKAIVSTPIVAATITEVKKTKDAVKPQLNTSLQAPKDKPGSEIIKSTKIVSNTKEETQKILSENSYISPQKVIQDNLPAVIITDTKRNRFNVGKAIIDSLKNWWTQKKEADRKNKLPRYSIPEAERRKGVIQKATTKTGRDTSADHVAVISRIKANKQSSVTNSETKNSLGQIKEPADKIVKNKQTNVEAVKWETDLQSQVNTHVKPAAVSEAALTGKEFRKIRNEVAAKTVMPVVITPPAKVVVSASVAAPIVANIPKRTPEIAIDSKIEKINPLPVVPTQQETPVPYSHPKILPNISIAQNVPEKIITTRAEELPVNKIFPVIPKINPDVEIEIKPAVKALYTQPKITPVAPLGIAKNFELPTLEEKPDAAQASTLTIITSEPKRTERRFAPPRKTRRTILDHLTQTNRIVYITLTVFIFIIIAGFGVRSFINKPGNTPLTETADLGQSIFPNSFKTTAPIYVSTASDILSALKSQASGEGALIQATLLNQTGNILSGSELLSILKAQVLFDFKANITDISVGLYRDTPWILLKIQDKNTTLGGMLDWENSIYRDLSIIFETKSFLNKTRFTDEIINQQDVRLLKDTEGTEEIVYGFIDYNSLLITKNSTAFLNLSDKLQ